MGFLVKVEHKQGLQKRASEVVGWGKSWDIVKSWGWGAEASLKCGQLGIPRRQGREMGGGATWLSWGPRAPGLGGWMPRKVEYGQGEPAVALCLPGPVWRSTEEQLREVGLLVEGAGAAGKGLIPFPGSPRVDFGSPTHECESL